MRALESLRVWSLVPKLKKFSACMILHRVQICVHLDIRHDQLLQDLPRSFSITAVQENSANQRFENVTKNLKIVLIEFVKVERSLVSLLLRQLTNLLCTLSTFNHSLDGVYETIELLFERFSLLVVDNV